MRLILSRKGFDSAAGGYPNPILPDERLIPLPIPDSYSPIHYGDITHQDMPLGSLVRQLTAGKIAQKNGAHLDPDLVVSDYPRSADWQPLLGQTGAAFGHLQKQSVTAGDLFLFFGVFQPIHKTRSVKKSSAATRATWRFKRDLPRRHILWGWLQIGDIIKVDELSPGELQWARYHPHFFRGPDANNHLYIARDQLCIDGVNTGLPGSGRFYHLNDELCLTAAGAPLTQWQLPAWWYPGKGRPPLSYHQKPERWQQNSDSVTLNAVARGQEFVLDCGYYPEAMPWLERLIRRYG